MQPVQKETGASVQNKRSADKSTSSEGANAGIEAPQELDAESLAAIRSLLIDDQSAEPVSHPTTPRPVAPSQGSVTIPSRDANDKAEDDIPNHVSAGPVQKRQKLKARIRARFARIVAGIKAYRPTAKHMTLAALVLLVLLRPWLFVGIVFLAVFFLVSVFLIVGYDGFWQRAMGICRWYASRRPERSAVLHQKLDRFAVKFDAFLDRFPEGSVDGLYLPDFGNLAEADARHQAAMDQRLDGLRDTKAGI